MNPTLELKISQVTEKFLNSEKIENFIDWLVKHKRFCNFIENWMIRLVGLFLGHPDWYRLGTETEPE